MDVIELPMVIQKDNKRVSAYTFFKNRIPGILKSGAITPKIGNPEHGNDIENDNRMTTFTAAMSNAVFLAAVMGSSQPHNGCE